MAIVAMLWFNFIFLCLFLCKWVVPENIHTHTTGGMSEFRRGGGVTSTGIPRTWGGSLNWNSEGMGGFSGE